MKNCILILLTLMVTTVFGADVKISNLPLGTGSTVGINDSFPYVAAATNITKRLTIYDLVNVPLISQTFAPKISPTFSGTVTAPIIVGNLTGNVTGNLTGNSAGTHTGAVVGNVTGNLTGNVTGDLTGNSAGTHTGPVVRNASTATALAANPTDCSTDEYANTIAANGNLTCSQVTWSQLGSVTGVIVNANVSTSAAIARSKTASGTAYRLVANDVSGVMSEAAAITASRALVSDANGIPTNSSVTTTEIGYVSGVTSAIQTQLGTKVTNPMTTGGDLIYGGASGVPTRLPNGNAGQLLSSSGTTVAPAWSTATYPLTVSTPAALVVNASNVVSTTSASTANRLLRTDGSAVSFGQAVLTTDVSGILPVANGGTGIASGTSGGILGYTASGTLASSGALTANQLIIGGGAGVTPSSLAAGTQYQVLRMGAANPAYGSVNLDQSAAVTGSLPVGNGGTGTNTLTANNVILGNGSSAVKFVAPGTSGNVLTSDGSTWASSTPTGSVVGFRDRFINGDFRIDQRNNGSAQTITAAAALAYTVDRWYAYSTGANVTGQQVAGATTFEYNYQFTGAASVTAIGFCQRVEARNSYDMNNASATISINTSNSLLSSVGWQVWRATTTADTFGTLASPTVTSIDSGTFTVNSSMARYSATVSLPSAATTGLQVCFTVGAQTSGTWKIGNAQLEVGTSATAFEQRPYGLELSLAQRYLPAFRATTSNEYYPFSGSAATTSAVTGVFTFPVPTRAPVTSVVVSASGDFKVLRPSTGSLTASGVALGSGGTTSAGVQWTVTGATVDQFYLLNSVNAGVIYFPGAEL